MKQSLEEVLPPLWRRRAGFTLFFFGALFLLYALRGVFLPFLVAWIAAYLVTPIVDWCDVKLRMSRQNAVLIVLVLLCLLALLFVVMTIPIVVAEAKVLGETVPHYAERLREEFATMRNEGRIPPEAEELARQAVEKLRDSAPQIAAWLGHVAIGWLSSAMEIVSFFLSFLMFVFIFFFFLRDFHDLSGRLIAAVPERWREGMSGIFDEMDSNLRAVLRGQLLVAVAMAILYAIGLSLAGVPYAALIGLVAGFGNFLPYIGPLLGLAPAFLFVGLHSIGNPAAAVAPIVGIIIVFSVVQFLESFILTPRIAGEAAGLGPVATLFALSAGGVLLGLLGVVAALPAAAIVKVLIHRGWDAYLASEFYTGVKPSSSHPLSDSKSKIQNPKSDQSIPK